ncbi:MAG: glucose 1-dehydrogenase [Candidatus Micrarchaeia archaeon]
MKGSLMVREVDKPAIGSNEVLVKVIEVGMDGTDKEIGEGLYGEAPAGSEYLIVGHEAIGVVEEVGSNVKGFKKDDIVVATVRRPDGCINCINGQSDMCLTGNYTERGIKGAHGYMTEYYKEVPDFLVKIPDVIKRVAVMLEPFSITEKAITQIFAIQKRIIWEPRTAVVLGTGSVGLFAAMQLRLRGIDVFSVDRSSVSGIKNNIFEALGIEHIDSSKGGIAALPKTIGKSIDIVIEATGNPDAVRDSLGLMGINGIGCLLSVTGGTSVESIDIARLGYDMVLGNRIVFGSVNSNRTHFEMGVNDMVEIEKKYGGILEKLITRFPVSAFKTYDMLNEKSRIKNVFVL